MATHCCPLQCHTSEEWQLMRTLKSSQDVSSKATLCYQFQMSKPVRSIQSHFIRRSTYESASRLKYPRKFVEQLYCRTQRPQPYPLCDQPNLSHYITTTKTLMKAWPKLNYNSTMKIQQESQFVYSGIRGNVEKGMGNQFNSFCSRGDKKRKGKQEK